ESGINSHFIEKISDTEQLIEALTILPLEVVVRNVAAGSFSKRFGVEEGRRLNYPIVEFYYKNDALDDPFMNDEHVSLLDIATPSEVTELKEKALAVNTVLIDLFNEIEITLIDFKLEFGKNSTGEIKLGDEISPDTCRLWDKKTNDHLDKDIYRRDLGDILPVYKEVLRRLETVQPV
ncbi:MAG: phosphoribosylaminoimidazolesuccinocarboxamide synthase, partial [Streptococcaceae bacterium]|nr:phosphoribosylaminoimidazolesuccinocarboxamide synthase [Streptococcaceae bacterium]